MDELDALKLAYHEEVLEGEDEVWDTVLGKVAFIVRSQLDFYDKIASKASDPVLEPLVVSIPDPFDSYGPPKEDGQIFSVLAPWVYGSIHANDRLGLESRSPPSPSITRSSPSNNSPGNTTPSKLAPFPVIATSPSVAVADPVSATGTLSDEGTLNGRAKRELSVIEERDASSVHLDEAEPLADSRVSTDESDDQEPTVDGAASPSPETQNRRLPSETASEMNWRAVTTA